MLSLLLTALYLLCGMLAAFELSFRFGRRRLTHVSDAAGSKELLEGLHNSTLGLFALLLGFTFSMALDRFNGRREILLQESNAIGTAILRADFLEPQLASELKSELGRYLDSRIELYEHVSAESGREAVVAAGSRFQHSIWTIAMKSGRADGNPELFASLMSALNEVFDRAGDRTAAMYGHVPTGVMYLLEFFSVVVAGLLGYRQAHFSSRAAPLNAVYLILIVLVIYTILDLSRPKSGLIQAGQVPMLVLQESLKANPDFSRF